MCQVFPLGGEPYPPNFLETVKTIFKRLFRIYAHIYHSHLDKFQLLDAEAHLNTCFKHFIYFTHAFSLVDRKELAPLQVMSGLPVPEAAPYVFSAEQEAAATNKQRLARA